MDSNSGQHVVTTALNYYLAPERGGDETYRPGAVGDKRRRHDVQSVQVIDIRGREDEFQLDVQGFQIIKLETEVEDVNADADWKGQYFDDIMKQILSITGASRAKAVSHIARRQDFQQVCEAEKHMDDDEPVVAPTYNRAVHVDQSYDHARNILHARFPEEAQAIGQKRWALVNVWRPLINTVTSDNLALCDARSVGDDELVALKGSVPQATTAPRANGWNWTSQTQSIELWVVNANPKKHKWYYCSKLTPHEGILFKQFDSKRTGVSRRTPHTAFVCNEDHGPTRQSVEARILLVWDDQTSD